MPLKSFGKTLNDLLIKLLSVALALFSLYTAMFGVFPPSIQRTVHLTIAISLGFLLPARSERGKEQRASSLLVGYVGFFAALVSLGYFLVRQEILTDWIPFVSDFGTEEFIVSIVAIAAIIAVGKKFTGNALPIIVVCFLLYGRWGEFFPGFLQHADYTWQKLMEIMFFGFDGVFGIPIGISSTIISIFIVFGCFFEISGGGDALMNLGKYLAGRSRGGPAKIAVVASALMGTISGSAVANVYATGTFSIPMMKKMGFRPAFAGAVEACASTGGQIVPPVMGAAAFIMADYTGLPYAKIALAAVIPAFLYYFSLFLSVDFEAAMTGIKGLPADELPPKMLVLKQLPMLTPVFVIVVLLTLGYSAMLAGVWSIFSSIAVSYLTPNKMTPRKIVEALILSGQRMLVIAVSTAMSGVIIGVVAYTSLGINFLALVMNLPEAVKWTAPLLVAVASIILGMGVPTSVAYIIVAAVAIPALRQLGYGVLESHMFAFYFAVLSMITPPVAPASLAASEIAGASFFETGKVACKIGVVTFIIPFIFLHFPQLLFVGSYAEILQATATSVAGVTVFTAGVKGWLRLRLKWYERLLSCVVGFLLILPGSRTDLAGAALLAALLLSVGWRGKQRNRAAS